MSTKTYSHLFILRLNLRNLIRLCKESNKVKERKEIIGASTIEFLTRQPRRQDDKEEC